MAETLAGRYDRRMNFLAHGYRYVDDPYFLAGTAVPDWLSYLNRKIRARRKLAEPYVNDVDPHVASVAAGIVQHHIDDQAFHGQRVFVELSMRFAVELRDLLPQDNGLRSGFVGHIVIELLLDSYLHKRYPGRLDRYYQAIRFVRPDVVQSAVNRITGKPTDRLADLIGRFADARFLYDYDENEKLLMRINQVLSRITLDPMPPLVASWIGTARERVEEVAPSLLLASAAVTAVEEPWDSQVNESHS